MPGDTFSVITSAVVRLQTLVTPVMDNLYLDTYYFYTPLRILFAHAKNFFGENGDSAWIPQVEYTIPKVTYPEKVPVDPEDLSKGYTYGWNTGTIADYMGIPVGVDPTDGITNPPSNLYPSALPFRAYAAIVNEWFRDQNLQDPINYSTGDANTTGSNGDNYVTDLEKGGKPFIAAKYHDYFTSCLPSPQKGPPVSLGGITNKIIPVGTGDTQVLPMPDNVFYKTDAGNPYPLQLRTVANYSTQSNSAYMTAEQVEGGTKWQYIRKGDAGSTSYYPTNLYGLIDSILPISVNDLRLAFQLQKFYEKNARAGTRYREVILEHFGTKTADARMMIPEYLGGHRFPLSIHQVANQAQGETEFLGDLGAMSNTSDVHEDFVHSFTEHGFVIGVCVVRYDKSYPQGLERFWTREKITDYFWPVFSNLGETPVLKKELYLHNPANSVDLSNNAVFGYQEYAADYRYKPSRVSGEMRPGVTNSLAVWHLSDYYDSAPSLSANWIREDKSNVDRVLQVTSQVSNQVFCDFYVQNICTRAMPMYSIPGLIDHH